MIVDLIKFFISVFVIRCRDETRSKSRAYDGSAGRRKKKVCTASSSGTWRRRWIPTPSLAINAKQWKQRMVPDEPVKRGKKD